jgi:hypothetical protein
MNCPNTEKWAMLSASFSTGVAVLNMLSCIRVNSMRKFYLLGSSVAVIVYAQMVVNQIFRGTMDTIQNYLILNVTGFLAISFITNATCLRYLFLFKEKRRPALSILFQFLVLTIFMFVGAAEMDDILATYPDMTVGNYKYIVGVIPLVHLCFGIYSYLTTEHVVIGVFRKRVVVYMRVFLTISFVLLWIVWIILEILEKGGNYITVFLISMALSCENGVLLLGNYLVQEFSKTEIRSNTH